MTFVEEVKNEIQTGTWICWCCVVSRHLLSICTGCETSGCFWTAWRKPLYQPKRGSWTIFQHTPACRSAWSHIYQSTKCVARPIFRCAYSNWPEPRRCNFAENSPEWRAYQHQDGDRSERPDLLSPFFFHLFILLLLIIIQYSLNLLSLSDMMDSALRAFCPQIKANRTHRQRPAARPRLTMLYRKWMVSCLCPMIRKQRSPLSSPIDRQR